jgi:hypothetical protein
MAAIVIDESNRSEINRAIPLLRDPYNTLLDFSEQLATDLTNNGITTDLWGSYVAAWSTTGYLDAVYSSVEITVAYNDTTSVWTISSIVETCNNSVDVLL